MVADIRALKSGATDKQEAIRKGMNIAKKFACGDICGNWECKLKLEDSL